MDRWLEPFAQTAFRRAADTAHDLKTPLNVAILNLELLKMRLAKLVQSPDDKIGAYAASIEVELRRMARIFDAFFLLSAPPKNEGEPRLPFVLRRCGQKKECIEDSRHAAQLDLDGRRVGADLVVGRLHELRQPHLEQLEIEDGNVERCFEVVRRVGGATEGG